MKVGYDVSYTAKFTCRQRTFEKNCDFPGSLTGLLHANNWFDLTNGAREVCEIRPDSIIKYGVVVTVRGTPDSCVIYVWTRAVFTYTWWMNCGCSQSFCAHNSCFIHVKHILVKSSCRTHWWKNLLKKACEEKKSCECIMQLKKPCQSSERFRLQLCRLQYRHLWTMIGSN